MTVEHPNTMRRALAPAMAAVAALTLAGCAATHVGEDWQCPLAQGARCVSVAAADPAVLRTAGPAVRMADPAMRGAIGRAQPPVEERPEARASAGATGTDTGTPAVGRGCPAFCRPFRWFGRLLGFGAGRDAADASDPGDSAAGAGPNADESSPAANEPRPDAELRRPETIGRVWIAPYVDAHGVYREASWVRVVIAPAAWRTR